MLMTHYILDGHTPIPCLNLSTWRAFIRDSERCTVGFDVVGTYQVKTTFIGINCSTLEHPAFFETVVIGNDNGNPPLFSKSWEQAAVRHRAMLRAVIGLTDFLEGRPKNFAFGFEYVSCTSLNNGLKFFMESEQAAIDELPKNDARWVREGNTLLLCQG